MKYLFTPEGEAALAAAMARRPLLAFDFDGTLAPIVARPGDAQMSLAVARRLDRLAGLLQVAIITGRSVADVKSRLTFQPQFIIGSHGAEDPQAGEHLVTPSMLDGARACISQHHEILSAAGVSIEDKAYSLALHYRLAPDPARAQQAIAEAINDLSSDVQIFSGKLVVNLTPSLAPDKASALDSLVARCGAGSAVFVGDDVNDEPVFARRNPNWFTVRVGQDATGSQAMFSLDHTVEMVTFLDRMLMLLTGR